MVPYSATGAYSIAYIMWLEDTAEHFADIIAGFPLDNKDAEPDTSGQEEKG